MKIKQDMYYFILFLILNVVSHEAKSTRKCHINNLTTDCSHRGLDHVPQNLPTVITELDLQYNEITTLRNNDFQRYKNLISLFLDNNKIVIIENNAFYGLEKLQILSMEDNYLNLTLYTYQYNVFSPLLALKSLDISRNVPREMVSTTSYPFIGKLKNIMTLSVDLIERPNFRGCGFENLSQLRKIVFDRCYIRYLTNTTFVYISRCVTEVHLRMCKYILTVDPDVLRPFTHLQVLHLYHSNIELSSALKLLYPFENKQMNTIDFTKVNPGYERLMSAPFAVIVTSEMMKHLQKIYVRRLILPENGIVDFEPNSLLYYDYPECFEKIVLSGNRFSFLNAFKVRELWMLSETLKNLTLFDLSYNPLSYEKIRHIINLPNDSMYSTSQCGNCTKEYTTRKHRAKAVDNKYVETSKQTQISFPLPPRLKTLRLTHFMSGQNFGTTILFFNASNLLYLDMSYFDVNNFPEIVMHTTSNIQYIDLSGTDSWRHWQSMSLFTNARVVVLRNAGIWEDVQHRERFFSFIPKVEKLDISENNLWQLRYDTFSENENLTSLIMQGNLFNTLPMSLFTLQKLKHLDVSENILDTINKTLRNWLDGQHDTMGSFSLSLSGNIFECRCENADFIEWIFKTNVILDVPNKDYKCLLSNGSVTTTDKVYKEFHRYFGNCNSEMWLKIGIVLLISFTVITIPLALGLNFKWQISYWIYRKFRKVVEKELKHKFRYDIYLSYTSDSLFWVKHILIPKIENSWKMKMCLEDRDILAGDAYVDAICRSIEQSRNILFIITDAFCDRNWGHYEIERAKYEKFTRKLQKIIVIVKQVSVENFPSELDHIWKDVILINWCEDESEINWDKLRMALFSELI